MPFLFVGERPSKRAQSIGASWRNGKLSAKVLHDALRAAGIDPLAQRYANLFVCDTGTVSGWSLTRIRWLQARGYKVVGLGRKVHRVLARERIHHVELVHPAARGRIRLRENYRAHVRETLYPFVEPW
jgi:hypothetical protein